MTPCWFVRRGNEVRGPISSSRLKRLAESGKLRTDDDVRKDGQVIWVNAVNVPGLFPDKTAANRPTGANPGEMPADPRQDTPSMSHDVESEFPKKFSLGRIPLLLATGVGGFLIMVVGVFVVNSITPRSNESKFVKRSTVAVPPTRQRPVLSETLSESVETTMAPHPVAEEAPSIVVAGIRLGMKEPELINAFDKVEFVRLDMNLCPRFSAIMINLPNKKPKPMFGLLDNVKDWTDEDFATQKSGHQRLVESLPTWMNKKTKVGPLACRYTNRHDWNDYWVGPSPSWQFIVFNGGPKNTQGIAFSEVKYHNKMGVLAVEFVYEEGVDSKLLRISLESKFGKGDAKVTGEVWGDITERIGKSQYTTRKGLVQSGDFSLTWRPSKGVDLELHDALYGVEVRLQNTVILRQLEQEARDSRYKQKSDEDRRRSEKFGL